MSSSSGRLCLRTTAPTAISGRDRIETDTNSVTGKSVVIRTDITIVGDLTPDGELAAYKISGQFNVGTSPAQGIVIHDAGTVSFDADGMMSAIHGIHDVFDNGEDAFCGALS